jgi:hydrogenase nickel incorporation protein HypA/HybF
MHKLSLMKDLIRKIETVARAQAAGKVVAIRVKLGALCHISPSHFMEHFIESSAGTVADGAKIEIDVMDDITHPQAQDVLLDSVMLEDK